MLNKNKKKKKQINLDIKDVLATVQTDEQGHFQISGNTANYQGLEANIDPYLKLYFKCPETEVIIIF